MISSWRRRRAARRAAKKQDLDENASMELIIPNHFLCPISLDLMKDPVTLSTGTTYDRASIEAWLEAGNTTCPITNQPLRNLEPIPNHAIRKLIQDWCVENRTRGVERIPTPKIPITSHEVLEILSKLDAAAKLDKDEHKCRELVSKIKSSAKESDTNKRCIMANGAGRVISAAFDVFSRIDFVNNNSIAVLEEILSALVIIIIPPLDEETSRSLSTLPSLQKIVWFLTFGNLSGRRNAILALKALVSSDQSIVGDVVKIEGAVEALVKLIKEPTCATTTKASLLAVYHMVTPFDQSRTQNNKKATITITATNLTEMGMVPVLLEKLVDSEGSICEKALGVLDGLCSLDEGRAKAYENAITIPLLVKKLLRVSDLATELSVSILLKLVRNNDENIQGGVIVEALQVGAFQKLLLLLQVGTNEVTKEKVTELLKLLNVYRNSVDECIDSLDFKDLKRPF